MLFRWKYSNLCVCYRVSMECSKSTKRNDPENNKISQEFGYENSLRNVIVMLIKQRMKYINSERNRNMRREDRDVKKPVNVRQGVRRIRYKIYTTNLEHASMNE